MFKFLIGLLIVIGAYTLIEVSYNGADNNEYLTLAGVFLVAFAGHLVIKS